MKTFVVFACLVLSATCQNDDIDAQIREIFATSSTTQGSFLSQFGEEVEQPRQENFSAILKCGEGEERGKRVCVPYYNCDGKTKTVITDGTTDGSGVIDIRFKESACDHVLDVCCGVPPTGVPPTVTTQSPVIDPSEPTSTIPPVRPGRIGTCGIRNTNGIDFKITGNRDHEAEYGEFPWMVAVLKKNYVASSDPENTQAICGGALITYNAVLTGGHCAYKYKTSDIKIRAGEWDTQTTRERVPYQERDVSNIIIHKDFHAQTLYNNVALLILKNPIVNADNVGTICLPPQGLAFNSRNCFATGWGKDKFGQEGTLQVILKKIELPIVTHSRCQDALRTTRLGKFFSLHESFTCAGGELGKDTCTGDGGSPLVCPDPSNPTRYLQAGIVSWGIGCGEKNVPGVYADVSKYRNWIDEQMAGQNLETNQYIV